MKTRIIRRFGGAWRILDWPFWFKAYADKLNERDDRIHWLAIEIDGCGATIEVAGFLCGVVGGRIQEKRP
jgi:hypothetical protein